jgi:hypothetical protein
MLTKMHVPDEAYDRVRQHFDEFNGAHPCPSIAQGYTAGQSSFPAAE